MARKGCYFARSNAAFNKFVNNLIKKYPLLSFDTERILIEKAQAGDKDAESILVFSNVRLIISIANRFWKNNLPMEDLFDAGVIGFIKSLENFNLAMGNKLSTYATGWIMQAISREVDKTSRIIRLPAHLILKKNKIKRARDRIENEEQRDASCHEIAKVVEMKAEKVEQIEDYREVISLDDFCRSKDINIDGIAVDDNCIDPCARVQTIMVIEVIDRYLAKLSRHEQQVLSLRFRDDLTQEEIGKICDVTKSRIQQIEARAIRKLKKMVKDDPWFTNEPAQGAT